MSDIIGPALPPHLSGGQENGENDSKKKKDEQKGSIGPALPPWMKQKTATPENEVYAVESNMGPALPPHLRKQHEDHDEVETYGPSLPPAFGTRPTVGPVMPGSYSAGVKDDHIPIIGPLPPPSNVDNARNIAEEVEKRSKKMKDRLTGKEEPKKLEREEWMTELPPLLQGFGGPGPRKFRAHERVIGDRSVWTDTPADKERKVAQKNENPQLSDQDRVDIDAWSKRDSEIAQRLAATADSDGKESLMSMHEKKMKRKAEEEEASGEAKIRRPFDRELDLQVNKFDEAAKKRMMKQSQGLSSRFSSGATTAKFL